MPGTSENVSNHSRELSRLGALDPPAKAPAQGSPCGHGRRVDEFEQYVQLSSKNDTGTDMAR
jgi:hypothetical protein